MLDNSKTIPVGYATPPLERCGDKARLGEGQAPGRLLFLTCRGQGGRGVGPTAVSLGLVQFQNFPTLFKTEKTQKSDLDKKERIEASCAHPGGPRSPVRVHWRAVAPGARGSGTAAGTGDAAGGRGHGPAGVSAGREGWAEECASKTGDTLSPIFFLNSTCFLLLKHALIKSRPKGTTDS